MRREGVDEGCYSAYERLKAGRKLQAGTSEPGAVGVAGLTPELCEAADGHGERLN